LSFWEKPKIDKARGSKDRKSKIATSKHTSHTNYNEATRIELRVMKYLMKVQYGTFFYKGVIKGQLAIFLLVHLQLFK
jgi:hypothetical protein